MIVRDMEGKGVGLLRGPDVKSWIFGKLYKPSGWGDAAKVRFSTSPNIPLLLDFFLLKRQVALAFNLLT